MNGLPVDREACPTIRHRPEDEVGVDRADHTALGWVDDIDGESARPQWDRGRSRGLRASCGACDSDSETQGHRQTSPDRFRADDGQQCLRSKRRLAVRQSREAPQNFKVRHACHPTRGMGDDDDEEE